MHLTHRVAWQFIDNENLARQFETCEHRFQRLDQQVGVDFDPDKAWDERRQVFLMSGRIVRTRAVTAATSGQKGVWTTTLACAVLLP